MRLADHQMAMWTCLMHSRWWWGSSGDLRSLLCRHSGRFRQQLVQKMQSSGGSWLNCKLLHAAAECRTLRLRVSFGVSVREWKKKPGESRTENMTWGTMHINTGAFQALTYRAELHLAPCCFISAQTWVSCVSVHFSLTAFSAAGSGSLASFSHQWGRSLISTNPPGWGTQARGRLVLSVLKRPPLVVDRTRSHSQQIC